VVLTFSAAALAPGQTPGTGTGTGAGTAATPGRATAAPAPPVPLAQFVAADDLAALVEFAGLDAHGDAWRGTAAYKILNTTSTGPMLESLLAQVLDQMESAPSPARLTGAEKVAIVEHVLRHGLVFAIQRKPGATDDAGERGVLVLRNAATKDARPVFGKLVGQAMGPRGKPASQVKGARKTVLVTPADGGTPWVWWTEKEDLVIAPSAASVDTILAALDGKAKTAVDHALRKELASREGAFQPVGLAFVDFQSLPPSTPGLPESARSAGLDQVRSLDFRWGLENAAMMSVLRLQAPGPRQGLLALVDQPTFTATSLPPLPASTLSFTALSVQPLSVLDALVAGSRSSPQLADAIAAVQRRVQEKTRRRFREDVLGQLGPKLVVFNTPPKATAARGPLAALGGLGLQVPRGAMAIEVKDPAFFGKVLDELIIFANQEMDTQLPALAPIFAAPPEKAADPNRPAPKKKGTSPNPNVPRFQLLSPQAPKLYLLRLPPALGALTNLNLTVALGKNHLVIATAADLARETLALEGKTDGRWIPAGDLAETFGRLPQGLTMLQVSDTSTTLPESLANLPATMATLNTALAAAASGRAVPGLPGLANLPAGAPGGGGGAAPIPGAFVDGGGGSGPSSGSSGRGDSTSGGGLSSDVSSGGSGSSSSSSGPSSGSSSGGDPGSGAPGGPAGARAPGAIVLDPAKAPKADEIRPLLFPGASALSVAGPEIRFESRTAFPNLVSWNSGLAAGLLAPAIQSAREAARRAQPQPPGAAATAPGATPAPTAPGAAPAPAAAPGAPPGVAPRNYGAAPIPGRGRGRVDDNP
jgi:hypothetical protein